MAILRSSYYGFDGTPEQWEHRNPVDLIVERARVILNMPVRLRGYFQAYNRHGMVFRFEIGDRIFEGFLAEGSTVEGLRIDEIPKPRCVSCGKEGLCIIHDFRNRCENYINSFWKKARRVYWHSYSRNNKINKK